MNLIERCVVYGLIGVLFLVGIFVDLPITQGLYDPSNIYGQFIEMSAEIPVWVLILFCLALGAKFHPDLGKKWLNIGVTVLACVAMAGVAYYAGHHFLKLLNRVTHGSFPEFFSFIYAFCYIVLSVPWVFLIKEDRRREMMVFAVIVLILLATTLVVMQGLKMLWLRPRYRTLVALYGVEEAGAHWLPVYKIQGFWKFDELYGSLGNEGVLEALGIEKWGKEEFYSFPSGHTMHAAAPLVFCLASSFLPKLKGKEGYIRIAFYVWGVMAGLGRIVRGAHNLTDVTFGFFVAVFAFDMYSTFLEKHLDKIYVKLFEKKEVTA